MIFNLNLNKDAKLQSVYDSAIVELNQFFGINWETNKPKVYIVSDRETTDALREKKTERWIIGWVSGKDVFVLNNDSVEKESDHRKSSDEQYAQHMKHELAHVFTKTLAKAENIKPKWLWEGVALYASGEHVNYLKPESFNTFLDFFDKVEQGVYAEAGHAVKLLIDKSGKEKVLELIQHASEFQTRDAFDVFFKTHFGFEATYEGFNGLRE